MKETRVTWKGWLSLFIFILLFSGLIPYMAKWFNAPWMTALDFSSMIGKLNIDLTGGEKSIGARRGFMEAFVLFPTVMLALGLIEIFEYYGALGAAQIIFQPLFRFMLGIPGVAGLAFVASLNSSDVGSVMTRQLREEGKLTEKERTIFVAYQYAASATITNTIGAGSALLFISTIPVGAIIGIQVIAKIIGANLVRLVLNFTEKNEKKQTPEEGEA